jgi:hypothetical protein
MRARLPWVLAAALVGCGDGTATTTVDARPAGADAPAAAADAPAVAADARAGAPDAAVLPDAAVALGDLDLQLADFGSLAGFMTPPGRSYLVANPLGHEAEALAAASSPTGGSFPVGSIVEVQAAEVMVKRRAGWNAATRDWEFFRVRFASDGTPQAFEVRGAQETACFTCHSSVSSATWDFMCDHP